MERHWNTMGILFFVIMLLSFSAWADVPLQINYQGYLADSSGMPVTGTNIPMKFRIFDVATGSTDLWAEDQAVDVQSGIYDVVLGDGTTTNGTFDTALFATQPLWLEVEVNGETMSPRQKITSVAYAMQAGQADTLDGMDSTDFMGTGGGTITGTLTLPADGLVAGTNQLVMSGGNVGIGTDSPSCALDVDGDIRTTGVLKMVGGMSGGTVLEIDTTGWNTFLGIDAGSNNTTGSDNTFLGTAAGYTNSTGASNTFIGHLAGNMNTGGSSNTFLGYHAGRSNTTGQENTFLGYHAGQVNSLGYNNTFLGCSAGQANTDGDSNTFLGYNAGQSNTSGSENIFLGNFAGLANTGGYSNISLGYNAGYSNTTGNENIFLGHSAGEFNTTGSQNICLGYQAGQANTTGSNSTFLGYNAGKANTTGSNCTFLGYNAGKTNTSGQENTFIGNNAGQANLQGDYNTFLGCSAGSANTYGNTNSFIGYYAGQSNTSGDQNVFLGHFAGQSNTSGLSNTFLGCSAGSANTYGDSNTFLGYYAGQLNTSGDSNTFLGYNAGHSNAVGDYNVFLGYSAGYNETGSNKLYIDNSNISTPLIYGEFDNDVVKINGDFEVTGGISGYTKITNTTNITNGTNFTNRIAPLAIGSPTGRQLLIDGNQIEQAEEGADIYINYVADTDVILAYGGGKVGIGMTEPTTDLDVDGNARFRSIGSGESAGAVHRTSDGTLTTSTSDRRLKTNIEGIEDGLEIVEALQGVRFNWKEDPEGEQRIGLIAQDAEEVIPELTFTNPTDGYMGINYAEITAVLIEAVKEQQKTIDALTDRINRLEEHVK